MKRSTLFTLLGVLAVALMVAAYFREGDRPNPPPSQGIAHAGTEKFNLHDAPKSLPEAVFLDANGDERSLDEFSGKPLLVNFWATWCLPCRVEMPSLDRLSAAVEGKNLQVITISLDRNLERVPEIFEEMQLEHLDLYTDPNNKIWTALGIQALPTTLLLDSEGRELGRLVAPAEWDSDEWVEFLLEKSS